MSDFQSLNVLGYHSCDKELGLRLVTGKVELRPSQNSWDWLGPGSYFWEEDPFRALEYATETAQGKQKNKEAPKTPFVVGGVIQLGNCLNLVESASMAILTEAYYRLAILAAAMGEPMLVNKGNNRALDCAVIKYIHEANKQGGKPAYSTIRCAFPEGEPAYPGAMISKRLHIQLCVCNPEMIKGYFLPRPVGKFNPYLF